MDDKQKQSLVRAAIEVAHKAYAPYSEYYVGAALLAKDGSIHTGCNVENASYPVTICAERGALMKAVSEGCREFAAIAVVSRNAGTPCGMCRQMLYEFAPDLQVILADLNGSISLETTLSDLLPHGFGPSSLNP